MNSVGRKANRGFNCVAYIIVGFVALVCLLPFLLLIASSFTAESAIYREGFKLIPSDWSIEAYKTIFMSPMAVVRAYGVSIFVTVIGTVAGLFIMSMTAYVLSRRYYKLANGFTFMFYFTTLFSGGMISSYILIVNYLNLKDNLLALILPSMISVMYLLVLKNFVRSIPDSLAEAAKIDGASEFRIFFKIYLPLMKSSIAAIGMFVALNYWNDWAHPMLYIENDRLVPLQYMMYKMLNSMSYNADILAEAGIPTQDLPQQSVRMAMVVVSIGPIVFVYPFVQKYFVQGMTIGSVKG